MSKIGEVGVIDFSVYEGDPLGFCRDILKVELAPAQERFLEAVLKSKEAAAPIAVPKARLVGKHSDPLVFVLDEGGTS